MVVQRAWLVAVFLLVLTGCDLLNFGEEYEDKTLYPLHLAIEDYIARKAESPDAEHVTGGAAAGHGSPITTPAAGEHATTETTGHGTVEPASDQHSDPTPEDASQDHGIDTESHSTETPVHSSSSDDEDAMTEQLPVAVVAVVDSYYLKQASEEDEEQASALIEDAQRRERVVRREIHKSLVENTLIKALPRDADNEALARQSIIENNSEALSIELCRTIGESLGTEIIICVLIDKEGAEVNVAAQVSVSGEMIYQDALVDWKPAVNAIEQQEETE